MKDKSIENDKVIIVYDGDCVFCSRSMMWIAKHDKAGRIRFTACTSKMGSELMKQHGIDPLDPSTFLVLIDGKPYKRSEAMLQLTKVLDRTVRPLGALRVVPSPLRNVIYDWTARNRRRLINNQTCPIPSREMIDRMLP